MNNYPQLLINFQDEQWTIEIIRIAYDDLVMNINHQVCPHRLLVQENHLFIYKLAKCQCQLQGRTIQETKLNILRYLLSRQNQLNNNQRLAIFNQQIPFKFDPQKTNVYFYQKNDFNLSQMKRLKQLNDDYKFRYLKFDYQENFEFFQLILINNRNLLEFPNSRLLRSNLKNFIIFLQLAIFNGIQIGEISKNNLQIGDIHSNQQLRTIQICYLINCNRYQNNVNNIHQDQIEQLGILIQYLISLTLIQEDLVLYDECRLIPLSTLSEYLIDGNAQSLNSIIQFLDNEGDQNLESPTMFKNNNYNGLQRLQYNRLIYKIYFIHETLKHCRQYQIEPGYSHDFFQIYRRLCLLLYKIQDETMREFLNIFPRELRYFSNLVHFQIYQFTQYCSLNNFYFQNIQNEANTAEILQYFNQKIFQNNLQLQKIRFRLILLFSQNFDFYLRILYLFRTNQVFNFTQENIQNWENIQQNINLETIQDLILLFMNYHND